MFTVTIVSEPDSPVLIGTTVTFTKTFTNAVYPVDDQWYYRCGEGAWAPFAVLSTPFPWCAVPEGSHEFKLVCTDATGATAEDIETIEVQGPDELVFQSGGPSNPSTGPGTIMSITDKFFARRGGVDVGPCWQCNDTTVYEYISFATLNIEPDPTPSDDTYEPDPPELPTDWVSVGGIEGCSASDNPAFFWSNPFILDKRSFVDPGTIDWPNLPVGHVIARAKQWVAIRVPICGDPEKSERFVIEGPMIFELRVGAGKTVDFVKIN